MSPTPKPTIFSSPQKSYMRYDHWPWPSCVHLQLHDMQPGDHWNATDGILLQNKRILLPVGGPGNYQLSDPPWFFQYRHRSDKIWIHVFSYTVGHATFEVGIEHHHHKHAHNEIQSPDDVFAYGGYATISWKAM